MSGFRGMGMHRVRWASGSEPEMQCERCFEYLPITAEFWQPIHGLRRCKACLVEINRPRTAASMRKRRADPALHAEELECRRVQREAERTYQREYHRRKYSTLARFQKGAA